MSDPESDPFEGVGVVETYTGGGFDIFEPDPEDVRLADIAAGLAHTCRFAGHCQHFYSVAHHSLHVSVSTGRNGTRFVSSQICRAA